MAAASNGKRGTDVLVSIFVLAFTLLLPDCGGGGGSGATASQVIPRFVYVANIEDTKFSQYTIADNGTPTPMSPATVAAQGSNNVTAYSNIDPFLTQAATAIAGSPYPTGRGPVSVATTGIIR
jgi:hypothetical protein